MITVISGFLFFTGTDALAAKKRKLDTLKYPELRKFELPEIQKAETANGIKLRLIKEEKLPVVSLQVILKGGSAYDPPNKIGLSDFMTHLLRIGGAGDLSGEQVDEILDSNGISISSYASEDLMQVTFSCLTDNFDQAIAIMAKIIKEPQFSKEKLEEIKTQAATGISRRNDQPKSINSREFSRLVYGDNSPFAPVMEYEHLDNISRDDIRKIHKMFFAPGNMLVGAVGAIEMADLEKAFAKHFGDWNAKAQIPPFPAVKEQNHDFQVAFAHKSDLNQSYLSIGHLGTKENLEDKAKRILFNSIFCEANNFNSRLMARVRVEMGLTYGISGGILTDYLYPGKTFFTTYTKCQSTLEALNAIKEEIERIRTEKVSQKELDHARDYFLNSYVFEFSTPSKILSSTLEREIYGIPENAEEQLVEDIKKVTVDDIYEVAQKYLHPDKMVIFVVGNEEKIKEGGDLATLGKVKKIDITIKPPALKEKIPPATPGMLKKGKTIIDAMEKKHYTAYKRLKAVQMNASTNLTIQGRTLNFDVQSTVLYPDKSYTEMTVMGMKIERIVNGDEGMVKQMGREMAVPEKDIRDKRFNDLYHIFNSKKNYNFQYLKEEEIEGKKYDVIYIFDDQENWAKMYINQETHLPEIQEKTSNVAGQTGITRTIYSDFKKIKGIPFNFKTVTYMNDKKLSESTYKEIKVNPSVDPSIFKLEKKQ
jgi:zinc protease